MKKGKLTSIAIIFAALIAAGCSGDKEHGGKDAHSGQEFTTELITVEKKPVKDMYTAVGTVKSLSTTMISAKVMGFVKTIHVSEGEVVKRGQLLIEIDAPEISAKVEQARAAKLEAMNALDEVDNGIAASEAALSAARAHKELAEATFSRFEALVAEDSVSKQEFDEVKAKKKIATAEVQRAEKGLAATVSKKEQVKAKISQAGSAVNEASVMLGYTKVISPMDGIILEKRIESGDLASPGIPLITIEDNISYRLETIVDESQINNIRINDRVEVRIDALGNGIIDGKVDEIKPTADAMSRSFTVKVSLPEIGMVHSGMFGRASFDMGTKEKVMIPVTAITRRGSVDGIFVVDGEGVLKFRVVRIGEPGADGMLEVFSGLNTGERIAVSGVDKLVDGGRVKER